MNGIVKTIFATALFVLCSNLFAISIDGNTGLLANGQVWIGSNSQIISSIGAGSSVSISRNSTVSGNTYSNNATYLGSGVGVTGNVSGNGVVSMDRNSSVGGNVYGGHVWAGRRSTIGGNVTSVQSGSPSADGGVSTGRGVDVGGNINAGGNIYLDNNTSVAGDASPGIGKTLTTGSNVSIGGSTTPSNPTPDTVVVPDIPTPGGTITPGTQSIWVGSGGSQTINPGDYANIGAGSDVDFALTAGNYTLDNLWMGNEGTMTFDTTSGDVIIDVLNNFGGANDMEFVILGPGEVFINVYEGDMSFGTDAILDGTFLVYEGDFSADNNSNIIGSIQAQNISLDNGAYFEYRGSAPPAVPEPLTAIALFSSVGGLGFYMRKRLIDEQD